MKQIILIKSKIIFLVLFSLLFNNEIDKIITEVINGNNDYSQLEILKELKKYSDPNNLILKGLIEVDGDKSFNFFNDYIELDNKGKYSELAVSKISEYYYAQGLYIKASNSYKKLIFEYPNSNRINISINYFLNSLSVSGNLDTAKYYARILEDKYPNLKFNTEFYDDKKNKVKKKINVDKRYSVEVGVYEKYRTASLYKGMLSSEGFLSRIDEVAVSNKTLYALRVGYYKDFSKANNIKKRIYSRLGLADLSIIESN